MFCQRLLEGPFRVHILVLIDAFITLMESWNDSEANWKFFPRAYTFQTMSNSLLQCEECPEGGEVLENYNDLPIDEEKDEFIWKGRLVMLFYFDNSRIYRK